MAKSHYTRNVGNDTDLKGPEHYGYFGATNLAQPSCHLSSNTPSCTLSFPGCFLSPPICTALLMLWPQWGRDKERGGRSPVFRFTVPVCQYFLIFQSPVLSREQLYCHPRGKSPATGSSAISSLSPTSEREKSNMRGSPRWWQSQGQGDREI